MGNRSQPATARLCFTGQRKPQVIRSNWYPPLFQILALCIVRSATATSKWENSRIWPAARVELYETGYHDILLRTFKADAWQFEYPNSLNYTDSMNKILEAAKSRFASFLERSIPKHSEEYPINPDNAEIAVLAGIRIEITNSTSTLQHDIDESYQIHIPFPIDTDTNRSWIELHAPTVYGALHGLETVKQLLQFAWMDSGMAVYVIRDTPLYIQDEPAYGFRGLMIDTARHYIPLDLILTNLNVMAANKLNVLHWHMTDSQSWPYQSTQFPELSQAGAYCPECIYDAQQIQTVIEEAALLGVRVIVELDLPGHSQAIGKSHPEFLSPCGGDKRSEPLDVTDDSVFDFVHQLYTEITQLFSDEWVHVGGDEVLLECWKSSTKIQAWMQLHNMTTELELLEYFEVNLLATVISKLHKRPIVWQDLFDSGVDLPETTILDVWKEWIMQESLSKATGAGYDVVFSACWYLDHLNEDWWLFYICNPRGFANLTAVQQAHILGGHSSMWGERVDSTDFFQRVWPRTSATAEALWSASPNNHSDLSYSLVQGRLERFRCWMVQQYDIPASPIMPGYCGHGPIVSDARAKLLPNGIDDSFREAAKTLLA